MPLLAGLGPLGVPELLIIAFIVVLIFGVGRLPEVGGAVGKGIKEFRKATREDEEGGSTTAESTIEPAASSTAPAMNGGTPASSASGVPSAAPGPQAAVGSETRFCSECGARNARSAKFCAECGHAMGAPV